MKFVMIPTWPLPPASYVQRGDKAHFLALPMPGQRVADVTAGLAGGIFPVVMPMDQLLKWWHRVRKWRLTVTHPTFGPAPIPVDLELTETGTLGEEIVDDMPGGWNNVGSADPLDWFSAGRWNGSFVWEDGLSFEHTAYFSLTILAKPDNVNFYAAYKLDSNFTRILPYMVFSGSGDGIDGNTWAVSTGEVFDPAQVSATVNIEGLAPSISAQFTTGSGFEDDPMTLTLTPLLYWEYRDEDGANPKYNAETGEKI